MHVVAGVRPSDTIGLVERPSGFPTGTHTAGHWQSNLSLTLAPPERSLGTGQGLEQDSKSGQGPAWSFSENRPAMRIMCFVWQGRCYAGRL